MLSQLPLPGFVRSLLLLMLVACDQDHAALGERLSVTLQRLDQPNLTFSTAGMPGPSIINLWASWCLPCRREIPELSSLAIEHGLPVYGLSYRDDPADAQRWLGYYGNPFRLVGVDPDGQQLDDLAANGLPQTILVDSEGRIHYHHVGPLTQAVVAEALLPAYRVLNQQRGTR